MSSAIWSSIFSHTFRTFSFPRNAPHLNSFHFLLFFVFNANSTNDCVRSITLVLKFFSVVSFSSQRSLTLRNNRQSFMTASPFLS